MRIHVSLNVNSIEDSTQFYSTLFGEDASKTREDYTNFRLNQPPIHLALQHGEPSKGGIRHLGVELPGVGVLQEWRNRLEASGVEFDVEDEARCCYATGDKLWINDPDGYRWEIWVKTGDIEKFGDKLPDESKPVSAKKACCA
jgi:catechol 2,3-dioxygenase-like lactoylglutathione lyase family enzyme